jgi:hypothetical protein
MRWLLVIPRRADLLALAYAVNRMDVVVGAGGAAHGAPC